MPLGYVGIVQKVPKVKKSARYFETRESGRRLMPLPLGPLGQSHTRTMTVLLIYMAIMRGFKRLVHEANDMVGA